LRVCRAGVQLGLPESRLGGLAGSGSVRLTRLIGAARAKELLYIGETIGAEQALDWGMVNRVVDEGSALDAARKLAATIASRGPLSNRFAKKLVDAAQDLALDAALSLSTGAQQEIFESADLHEGAAAFLAKRAPQFTGR
jgi:enoyl-CoA hydratase/carnithine racemase